MNSHDLKIRLINYSFDQTYLNERIAFLQSFLLNLNKMEGLLACDEFQKLLEVKSSLEFEIFDLTMKNVTLFNLISSLPHPYKLILHFRYVQSFSFTKIASKMFYSEKRIYQLHSIACILLENMLNSSVTP